MAMKFSNLLYLFLIISLTLNFRKLQNNCPIVINKEEKLCNIKVYYLEEKDFKNEKNCDYVINGNNIKSKELKLQNETFGLGNLNDFPTDKEQEPFTLTVKIYNKEIVLVNKVEEEKKNPNNSEKGVKKECFLKKFIGLDKLWIKMNPNPETIPFDRELN